MSFQIEGIEIEYTRTKRLWITNNEVGPTKATGEIKAEQISRIVTLDSGNQKVTIIKMGFGKATAKMRLNGPHCIWYEYVLPRNPQYLELPEITFEKVKYQRI